MSIQRTMIVVWLLALVALTLIAALQYQTQHKQAEVVNPSRKLIQVGSAEITVEVADTLELQTRGLSGRDSLQEGEGMLFVFAEEGTHGIWMKDMRFSIDIAWAASDGTILTIEESVSPATYPESFYATTPQARYVLEVPAGYFKRVGVAVGDKIVVQ